MAKTADPDILFASFSFDYDVIARQLKESREIVAKAKHKAFTSPRVENLTNAITSVSLMDTLEGSSTLEIGLSDPEFELFEFFDIDANGKLDVIELNYPPGSPSWWRLTQLNASTQAGQALELTLTFMERPAVLLMNKRGPKKTKRGKTTRAEFMRSCVKDIKAHPLKFVSGELHVTQRVAGSTPVDDKDRHDNKDPGLHYGEEGVTVKGVKATRTQFKQAERSLDVATRLNAPHDAAVALMMTAIGESNLGAAMDNPKSVYGGVFAGSPANFPDQSDTEAMAEACLKGGKGFNAPEGGLIGGVQSMGKESTSVSTYRSLGHLCYVNQGNRTNFGSDKDAENFFGKWESEAEDWVKAYGDGFTGGNTYYRTQFYFQIGTPDFPKERYWDGMRGLADEVRWRLFVDGRTVYFDSDMTLIRQKPIAIINRIDPAVLGFDATWDGERHIATEMQLELICRPFQFRAGQVVKLLGFGPLSTGSTVRPRGLPGRWLIWEINRNSGAVSSSLTLRQPQREKLEPATELAERADHGPTGGSLRDVDDSMTPKDIIDEFVLPIGRKHNAHTALGAKLTGPNVVTANRSHGGAVGSTDHAGPPDTAWAVDMGQGTSQPTPELDGLADELARKFGFTQHHNHVYNFGTDDVTKDGVRYQLGFRVADHFDHVHFGCKVTDPSKRAPTPEQGPSSHFIRTGPLGY